MINLDRIKLTLSEIQLPHSGFDAAIAAFDAVYSLSLTDGPGILLLTGDAGTGKTTICNAIRNRYPNSEALIYALPDEPRLVHVKREILTLAGDPHPTRDLRKSPWTERVTRQLAKRKVSFLVLDEIHHLFLDANFSLVAGATQVRNWLKVFADKAPINIGIIGLPQTASLIDGDPQLGSRISIRRALGDLPLRRADTSPDATTYPDFLATYIESLKAAFGIESMPDMDPVELATRMYYLTRGNFRRTTQFIFLLLLSFRQSKRRDSAILLDDLKRTAGEPYFATLCYHGNAFVLPLETLKEVTTEVKK